MELKHKKRFIPLMIGVLVVVVFKGYGIYMDYQEEETYDGLFVFLDSG